VVSAQVPYTAVTLMDRLKKISKNESGIE